MAQRQIFISYRRNDSKWATQSLYNQLLTHFPAEQVFMDMDDIKPGEDFVEVIEKAVGQCEVLLAVMGEHWSKNTGSDEKLLHRPNDFVRLEIAAALKRSIPVIPVLLDNAAMPDGADLPEDIRPFVRRQAFILSHRRFKNDCDNLVQAIHRSLEQAAKEKAAIAETIPLQKPIALETYITTPAEDHLINTVQLICAWKIPLTRRGVIRIPHPDKTSNLFFYTPVRILLPHGNNRSLY